MIKDLIKNVEGNFFKLTIINIWRKIITCANMEEQALKIGIHNPLAIVDYEYLVREYFSQEVAIINFDSATNLIAEMEKSSINIGVFLLPSLEDDIDKKDTMPKKWWINIASNPVGLKIYAKIPFVKFSSNKNNRNINLVLTAIKDADQSSSDYTIISLEVANEIEKNEVILLLNHNNFNYKILSFVKNSQFTGISLYLIEIKDYLIENDLKIKQLLNSKIKPFIKILGHYPEPILLD